MAQSDPSFTFLLNHPLAEKFAGLIHAKFPHVRAVVAPDDARLEQHIGDADALLAFRFPVEVFDRAGRLRWFQCTGAGVDSLIPIRHRLGQLIVTNARGIHGDVIADYVMAGVTALHWDLRAFLRNQSERRWSPRAVAPLADKTLGVVGLGSIGATIARRAKAARMTVLGTKRDVSSRVEGVDKLFPATALNEMLSQCDFVVLALPSTEDTTGLIGHRELASMRQDAFLINIARGTIVVERDLIRALEAGAIAGAMLDVFEKEPLEASSPLWSLPNVIVTPHVSGNPPDYPERVFAIIADNIDRFTRGEKLTNVVDLSRGY